MSQSGEKAKLPSTQPGLERKSGRAVFDQGRTVWEWQTATGVFERHVSDEQLARLEAADLQLVEQRSQDTGRAIYDSEQVASQAFATRKQVYAGRPMPRVPTAPDVPRGMLRQLWRRLLPST